MRINDSIIQPPTNGNHITEKKGVLPTNLSFVEQSSTLLKRQFGKCYETPAFSTHSRLSKLLTSPLKNLNSPNPPVMHTVEFQGPLTHDTNFNNKQKAKAESFAAAHIINNPGCCVKTVNAISNKLLELTSKLNSSGGEFELKLLDFIEKDTGGIGQFGRIEQGINGVLTALRSETTPITLIQKVLIMKSFGAFVIDHVSKAPANYDFLPVENTAALIEKNRPNSLFEIRGRSTVVRKENREDIGILDKKEFDLLSKEEKKSLLVSGLHKERLTFRTFTHEAGEDKKRNIESVFVNRTFDSDSPLVASISGSTSCIMVCADLLLPNMTANEKKEIAIAAVGFLVGGAYHSVTEVLDVAYPGLDLKQELNL